MNQQISEPTKASRSSRVSIKRILIALTIVILPILLLIGINSYIEGLECYCDLDPLYMGNGKELVFIRWFLKRGSIPECLELWTAEAGGGNPRRIFKFDRKFLLYGIRFYRVVGEDYVARLCYKDLNSSHKFRDFIYVLPLSGGGQPVISELDKNSDAEIFLACDGKTALVRRYNGSENRIEFMDLKEKRVYSSMKLRRGIECSSATLYGGGKNALLILEDRRKKPEDVFLCRLDRDRQGSAEIVPVGTFLNPPIYLPRRRQFVAIPRQKPDMFYLIDENLKNIRKIPNPTFNPDDKGMIFEISASPDENYILHANSGNIIRINMDTGECEKIALSMKVIPAVQQSPGEDKLLFSNGSNILSWDIASGVLSSVTELSPRYRMEMNPVIHKCIHMREYWFWKLYGLLYPGQVPQLELEPDHSE